MPPKPEKQPGGPILAQFAATQPPNHHQECSFVPGCMPIGVGRNSTIRKALVDKNVRIGDNVRAGGGEGAWGLQSGAVPGRT
jgi:ADP-glucose pyrophosphorylase